MVERRVEVDGWSTGKGREVDVCMSIAIRPLRLGSPPRARLPVVGQTFSDAARPPSASSHSNRPMVGDDPPPRHKKARVQVPLGDYVEAATQTAIRAIERAKESQETADTNVRLAEQAPLPSS